MSSPSNRAELIAELAEAVQRSGRHAVLFHVAVADQLGISAADSRVLSYIQEEGPVSAGELAELTGLTSGAVTGIIDRLEEADFVRRRPDEADRRRVLVMAVESEDRSVEMRRLFGPLGMAFQELAERYDADALSIVLDFVNRATDMLRDQTGRLLQERSV